MSFLRAFFARPQTIAGFCIFFAIAVLALSSPFTIKLLRIECILFSISYSSSCIITIMSLSCDCIASLVSSKY